MTPRAACSALVLGVALLFTSAPARADEDPLERGPELGLALDLAAALGLDDETLALGVGQAASLALLVRPHPVISLAVGAQAFALYGDGPIAWIGTRTGLRFHWGELVGFEPDAWIEVSHVYGFSSAIARHGIDFGLGLAFPLYEAVAAGPFVRVEWIEDPDGTPVWLLALGLTVAGWPARSGASAPPGWVSRARPPRYVAPRNAPEAALRPRASLGAPFLLPDMELFGVHAIDDDHRDLVGFGGGITAAVEVPIVPWLGVHAGIAGMAVELQSGTPAAWAGTRLGLRFHWTAAAGIEGDGWIDAHHAYGVSGGIATHGADFGIGYAFDVLAYLRMGPMARVSVLHDPGAGPAVLLAAGLSISVRPPERGPGNHDGDEYLDREDRCAEVPSGPHRDADNPGCPLLDRDGDGVPDDRDRCDTEPAGDEPDPRFPGCPRRDRDGDGVPDDHDFCPDVAGTGSGDPLRDGCPIGAY